jgi:hypothetical protein
MAYLRIPPSFLPNAIAKLVSKLEVELNTRVQAEAGKIVDKIRSEGCPADLGRAVQKVKGLSDGIGKLQSRMTKLKKLPETLLIPIKILEKIAQVILSLPVPQSPSPIPGLPISVTNKLTDLIIVTYEFIAQKKEDAEAIVAIVDGPSIRLEFVNTQLQRVNRLTGICRVQASLERKLEEGELTFEELVARGLINDEGGFVTSDLGRQFLGGKEGRSISDLADEFNISNEQVVERLKDANINSVSDLDDNDLQTDNKLNDLLNKLDGLDLDVVTDIRNQLDQFSTKPVDTNIDGDFFHRGPSGILYKLEIRNDIKSPKVAVKRFAVALDEENVVVLEGPKSFASDTEILLNEIKFRLDNQLS